MKSIQTMQAERLFKLEAVIQEQALCIARLNDDLDKQEAIARERIEYIEYLLTDPVTKEA